ncbi:MAG: hypothetical protein ABSD27_10690 [Bryobacteraceae bacterium]
MPSFRIHRLREASFQQLRWAPHITGASQVRPRDYLEDGRVEAPSVYAAWSALRESEQPLRVGDLLEDEDGHLRIYKYVGFEAAEWLVAEPKPSAEAAAKPPASTPETESPGTA